MHIKQAFSLIELMIVIAIIGILATIAVPSYQNYLIRSKVTEAISLALPYKVNMSEYVILNNGFPTQTDTTGIMFPASKVLYQINLYYRRGGNPNQGLITIIFNPTLFSGQIHLVAEVQADKSIKWTCAYDSRAMYKPPLQYLPASCLSSYDGTTLTVN